MTKIYYEDDAEPSVLDGQTVAVVALADGFDAAELEAASGADVICYLVPDDVIPAPRMLGPEVRRCNEEGSGFITDLGVERDPTGKRSGSSVSWACIPRRADTAG